MHDEHRPITAVEERQDGERGADLDVAPCLADVRFEDDPRGRCAFVTL
jgi:hypothetical protein